MIPIYKLSQIDLNLVKDYLQIDYDDDDLQLQLMIQAAQNYIVKSAKTDIEYLDRQPDLVIACLQIVSHFYENKGIVTLTNTKIDTMLQNILVQYKEWF